jgi:hypothetical protein
MQHPQSLSSVKAAHVLPAAIILLCIALIPLSLVHIPPLVDYPNHMARMQILADDGHSEYLSRYYRIRWDILPNLAIDVLVPALARLVGIEVAGKIFIGLTLFLLSGGVIALHYALHERWSWWPLTAFLFLFNSILLWGFLNYLFGLGLAIWCFAGWVAHRHRPVWQTMPLFSVLTVLLFFSHLFAFGVYVLLLSGYELGQRWRHRPSSPRLVESTWAKAALSLLLPTALLLASPTFWPRSDQLPLAMKGTSTVSSVTFVPFSTKVEAMKGTIRTNHQTLDRATVGVLLAVILGGFAFRSLSICGPMFVPLAILGIAALAMPSTIGAMSMVEIRMPIAFVLLAVAGSDWKPVPRRWAVVLAVALASLFLLRVGYVSLRWQEADFHYTQFVEALDRLPQGVRLFSAIKLGSTNPVDISETRHPEPIPMANLACWAVITRAAFVSNIFSAPSQQPIELTPAYSAMPAMEEFISHRRPIPWNIIGKQYDYLVVRRGQNLQPPFPAEFVAAFSGDEFQFYRLPGR